MTQQFFDIAELGQRYQVPIDQETVLRLGQICGLTAGTRVLDLACGKGELLSQWVLHFNIKGTGVDNDPSMIYRAMQRSDELKVWSELNFQEEDPSEFPQDYHQYDIVTCFRTSLLGTNLAHTLDLMRTALKDEGVGLLIVGETFWQKSPTDEVCDALGVERDVLTDMAGISRQFASANATILNMLVTTPKEWDAYYTQRWMSVHQWLQDNQFDPNADTIRQLNAQQQQQYLQFERKYIGWGIFVVTVD